MRSSLIKFSITCCLAFASVALIIACGGSSGGGDSSLRIQGKLVTAATSRTAQTASVGIPGVTVNALGDSAVTDANGSFSLQGALVAGGEILVEFVSDAGTATSIVSGLPEVPAVVEVDFTVNPDLSITSMIVSITEDGASPTPTETESPEPTETASPEPTETASPEPTETASPEPTETASPEPTETASPEPTETASPEPTETASPEPTDTGTPGLPSCQECIDLCAADPASGGDRGLCETLCTTGFGDLIPPGLCP